MSRNFHEAYAPEPVEPPSPAATGYVFAGVCAIVAVLFRDTAQVVWPSLALSAVFAGTAVWRPTLLGPLNRVWFGFARLLNRIMNPIVMFMLFAGVIVPYGLGMQLFRNPLQRKRAPEHASYWVPRQQTQIDLTQQF